MTKCPYYVKSFISVIFYPNAVNEEDVKTFGVKATLVISDKIPGDVVCAITKDIFENLESFKKIHSTCEMLTKERRLYF